MLRAVEYTLIQISVSYHEVWEVDVDNSNFGLAV
jgi:hypothetical protein